MKNKITETLITQPLLQGLLKVETEIYLMYMGKHVVTYKYICTFSAKAFKKC